MRDPTNARQHGSFGGSVDTFGTERGELATTRPLLSFGLGDQACGDGWHLALWRDGWRWGPCVPNR